MPLNGIRVMTNSEIIQADPEQQRKTAIRNTFNTVAHAYGSGACRFFHLAGEFMADSLPLQGKEHVLDVASGTGAAAIPLARRLPQGKVSAVDFSAGMLSQAQGRASQEQLTNIDFHTFDMTAMTLPEQHFDHANCAFGLFFVQDMTQLLSHIGSKVKPGGSVTVSGFCGESFMPYAGLAITKLRAFGLDIPEQPFGWKRMAEPEQLCDLFASAGLRDVEIVRKSLGYYTDAEGWWEVIWNAGFRGLVAQLGERVDEFKRSHLEEVSALAGDEGVWLEIDVNFTRGIA